MHIAIIMDGNGRWAAARSLPRLAGHRAGVCAVRRIVEAACELGIPALTLYAFSSDNWKRPAPEVEALMDLLRVYLAGEMARCVDNGIRVEIIGRRDRLPPSLVATIGDVEQKSAGGQRLHLRIAVDYSARDSILRAARHCGPGRAGSREQFARLLGVPDVDLLIRTGGEQRLSDFLLWEAAYAELVFTDRMWPDFTREDLDAALHHFTRRQRRFGGLLPDPEVVRSFAV